MRKLSAIARASVIGVLIGVTIYVVVDTTRLCMGAPERQTADQLPLLESWSQRRSHKAVPVNDLQIRSWRLFAPDTPDTAALPKTTPRTSLNLSLFATFSDTNQTTSGWAIIKPEGGPAKLFRAGETIGNAVILDSIHPHWVILRFRNNQEKLEMVDFDGTSEIAKAGIKVAPASRSKRKDTPKSLFSYSDMTPVQEGVPAGYRIGDNAKSIQSLNGLESGDILLAINGYPLGTASDDALAIDSIVAQGDAEATILRKGQSFTIKLRR